MGTLGPDTTGLEAIHSQPEFNEQLWQYLNRRVSDWRITTGKEKAQEYAPLFARIEKDFGVERSVMLGIWGIESAFGDPLVQQNHMRPVIPSLAALAWGEPRRRAYWEQELLNALVIVERGWGRLDFSVLHWNPARDFYHRLGIAPLEEWLPYRASGAALERLAAEDRD